MRQWEMEYKNELLQHSHILHYLPIILFLYIIHTFNVLLFASKLV